MTTKDVSRAEFEAWAFTDASPLFPNEIENPLPDGSYRTSGANAAWVTWQAARDQPTEPLIDGYPLWSGLPPPIGNAARAVFEVMGHDHTESWDDCTSAQKEFYVCIAHAALLAQPVERVALSDAEILRIEDVYTDCRSRLDVIEFARALLAAQADHSEDVRDMVDSGQLIYLAQQAGFSTLDDAYIYARGVDITECTKRLVKLLITNHIGDVNKIVQPITQPLIAEAARDDRVDDLAALVRRLARSLSKAAPDNDLPAKAVDYLQRKCLQGSPLRYEAIKRDDVAWAVRFAGMVLSAHRNDGYPGDVDGADLQRMALECGLIEERIVAERCGEFCTCAEVATFPLECFFNTDAGRAAIAASTANDE